MWIAVTVAVAIAGVRERRTGDTESRCAGDENNVFHNLTIVDLRA
jgi:hypothetical protein